MMCAGLHSEKSLSLTKVTAQKAVVEVMPLRTTKGSRKGVRIALQEKRGQHCHGLSI